MWFFGKSKAKAAVNRPGLPTVSFDAARVTLAVEAEIRTVLKEAGREASSEAVYEAALRCVRAGGDLATLYQALIAAGLSPGGASGLAQHVNSRAKVLMDRDRTRSLGVTEAVWIHSGAPCSPTRGEVSVADKKRDQDHRRLNGKRFPLAEGALVKGRRIWPGYEVHCKCVSKSIIAGFE